MGQSGSSASTAPPEGSSHRSSVTAQNSGTAVAPIVNNSTVGTMNINVQTCEHSAENSKMTQHTPAEGSKTACSISLRVSEELKSNLKGKFQMIFDVIPKRGKQTSLNEIYTELYITEGERKGLNKEHEVLQTDPTLQTPTEQDKLISCNDIFKPLNNQKKEEEKNEDEETPPRTVLTKGIAGIGKTFSVRKFILDWAEGEANQDIDLLLVLPFRELNSVKDKKQSLHELLLDFHTELKEFVEPECYKHCKILFIFDGLDESQLPLAFGRRRVSDVSEAASLDELMTNLIKGNLLPKALVWITSRPAAIDKIPENLIHRMTEVQGFTDEQKQEYFRKKISDESMAKRIISHVKDSRTLEIMCHIPIFCWITATVLEHILKTGQENEVPSSLTELYTRFLLTQTRVKKEKYCGDTGSDPLKLSVADGQLILKLGKLAFENLQKKIIVFSEDDLKNHGVNIKASLRSGVFTEIVKEEDPMFSVKKYSFVHLSFQEYLAAVYVVLTYANKGENEVQSIQKKHPTDFFKHPGKRVRADEWDGDEDDDDGVDEDFYIPHKVPHQEMTLYDLHKCAIDMALRSKSGHLDLFLRFLLGLSLESALKWFREIGIRMNVETGQKITEQTIEYLKSNLREEYDRKIPSSERCINLFHCLLELNDHSIAEEIQRFLTSDKQAEQRLTAGQCSALAYIILMSGEILEELDLKKYNTSDEGRRRLVPVVKTCRKALLSHCSLSDKCLESVASALQNPKEHLKELSLIQNFLDNRSLTLLCAGLGSPHCRLETLSLCDADLEKRGEDLLRAVLMAPHIQLHTLKLFACNLKDASAEIFVSVLSSSECRLRELDLSYNNLTNNGVKFVLQGLLSPTCRVEILRLAGNMIDEDCCTGLASVLKRSFLKELILDRSNVGDMGVEYLCKGLMSPDCKLEILGLRNCKLSEKACSYLTEALSSYSVLRDLNLGDNDLQDSGVELLSTGLKHQKCILQNLGLSGCMITEKGCGALASALESNPSHLRELDLSYNHPGTSGEELLNARLEDPQCRLETLRLDHGGPSRITPGLWKYYQDDKQENLPWSSYKQENLTWSSDDSHESDDKQENLTRSSDESRFNRFGAKGFSYYKTDDKDKEGLWPQLCSIEKLVGERFYWELKWTGIFYIGVTDRKVYMCNSQFIVYEEGCREHKHTYQSYAKSISEITKPERIGVLLDWPAGSVGLFGISSQGVSHLHTFHTKFDKHRYPAEDIGHRLLLVSINTTQSPEFSFSATFKITEPV